MTGIGNDERWGEVLREGGLVGLRYVRRLRHGPEKVWRALTESEHLRHWMPTDVVGARRAGADLELPFWPPFVEKYGIETPVMSGRILVWEPPRVFEWTWDVDRLRFELEPADGGTILTFTTWLGADEPRATANTGAGYHACLDALTELLDTGRVAIPLLEAETAPLEARYAEAVDRAGPDATSSSNAPTNTSSSSSVL